MAHLALNIDMQSLATERFMLDTRGSTREEYLAFCAANPDLRVERLASGEIIVMPPAHSRTGAQNAAITAQLVVWALQNGTGVAFDSSAGFDLPNGANRSPDASWVSQSRIDRLSDAERRDFYPLCPDFVIELRSDSDRLPTVQAKMDEYLANGARLGWLIDPRHRTVHIYRPGREPEILDQPAVVSGDPELPGFELKLLRVWELGALPAR